jgi:MoaA/NifB/PqqE/SkfB family radical SAM enzyme
MTFNILKCDASKYSVVSVEEAKNKFYKRAIYIWGAGQKGRGFVLTLKRNGFKVKAFLDSSPSFNGCDFNGIPILNPNDIFQDPLSLENSFIITASVDKKYEEMFPILEGYGFKRGKNYDSIQSFSPFYPTVEISGVCNLRCSSCPRGDTENPMENGKYMSASNYKKIIEKMVTEIPFLYLVDLYVFGEPILNKELPEIIKLNNKIGLASGLSTNLNNIKNLENVIAAKPAQIRVSLSGASEETYEKTHTGGKWKKVRQNLDTLGELIKKHENNTLIEVYFHYYQHNLHEINEIKSICNNYGFTFHPSLAVLFPDYALEYCETNKLPKSAVMASDLMIVNLDSLINDCRAQDDKNCILTRVVPVINWDMSVMPCCNYAYSQIAKNYLEVPLDEIISTRTTSDQCIKCQKHSLHRWNNQAFYSDVLDEATPCKG